MAGRTGPAACHCTSRLRTLRCPPPRNALALVGGCTASRALQASVQARHNQYDITLPSITPLLAASGAKRVPAGAECLWTVGGRAAKVRQRSLRPTVSI